MNGVFDLSMAVNRQLASITEHRVAANGVIGKQVYRANDWELRRQPVTL